ncbi:sodium/hydrogen exchanger 9B1 isoform X3 [Phodopus roborovskii]|uniref:sodium/hydrogen exchanger 9B1 isoform X3 n=1 Tax=Phodopus roborovskii TaxID=109678 RepID=UPI0021E45ABC|nr:sodium/hydrogen exchanger 9B1 isoform X3 [Phodopus roborovskii]
MYDTESVKEDVNLQPPSTNEQPPVATEEPTTITQMSSDPGNVSHEGTKETKQQVNRSTNSYCPPHGTVNKIITDGVTLIVLWTLLWSLMGNEVLPGGNLFGLIIIFYSAFLGGKILELIRIPVVPPLPPLLGMLLAGFTIRNVPIIYEFVRIPTTWSSALRNTALTIILIRAGLGLDPQALKHLKGVCLRLSFGPCIIEACSAAFFSHFLMKFPWQWGFLLGFVLGAVSPAVVVPSMLLLQENGYGVEKGIPTLLVAASSMDDVVAITGFNTFLSIVFSSGSVISNILSSLRNVFIGVLLGIAMGFFIQYFPSGDQEKLTRRRAFLVLSMCISAVLGCQYFGLHGSGGLVTLVLSFMAAKKWAKDKVGVQKVVANTWNIFQPLLFGLVGTEVSVESLESRTIGCLRSSGSRNSKKGHGTPARSICKGCHDSGLSSHPDHSSKWGPSYRHTGTQNTRSW